MNELLELLIICIPLLILIVFVIINHFKEKNDYRIRKTNIIITSILLIFTVVVCIISGRVFVKFTKYDTVFIIRDNIEIEKFSKYSPKLKGTVGDSDIYVIKGEEPGPSVLIIGGTHPNEVSGQLTATLFLENINVTKGTFYIITEANKSGYTYSYPQEGSIMYYTIKTQNGERLFKYGSRATNFVDQWPNPDVYVHATSGQKLSTNDTRNLNRAYPGQENGNYTEKVAYAIYQLIKQNNIDVTIDLHEASPEYKTINQWVYHERAAEVAAIASMNLEMGNYSIDGLTIPTDASAKDLHGLSHRELGDFTDSLVILCETSNASQGKYRGAFTEEVILTGNDKFYKYATSKNSKNETIIYGEPVDISQRVARHSASILSIVDAYNEIYGNGGLNEFVYSNVPSYDYIIENGIGYYLLDEK